MCGIVGVVGNQNATEMLLQGLEKLEYRGYDSAGIFVLDGNKEQLVKEVGRIKNLRAAVEKENVSGALGIGHTRWATHGKPTKDNAHPHCSEDQRYALVHNGVIENYKELKEKYLRDVNFHSDTDTEVIVQLVGHFAKEGLSTKEAFKKVLSELEGSYALALIDVQDENTLYVAKNKSPLLVGIGEDFHVVCSDAMAMVAYTKQFLEIMDKELVILTKEDVVIEDVQGQVQERTPFEAKVDMSDIDKGTYEHYMLKEIDEQPAVMRKIIQAYQEKPISQDLLAQVAQSDRIYIVACGTSAHAGWIGKNLIENWAGIPVEVHIASEFGYHQPVLSERPFFIFISQSGETADSRQVLVKVKEQGYPMLTLTNVEGSTLSREANATLLLHAGPEIAVASTKAYTAQVAVLSILAQNLGAYLGKEEAKKVDVFHELSIVANAQASVLAQRDELAELADRYLAQASSTFYLGRYNDYYVALEAALKLKEISYIQAEGFAAGELKHGPIALIEEGVPVVVLMTDPTTVAQTRGNIEEVQSRGAEVISIATEELANEKTTFVLENIHPLMTALVSVVPCQLLAYYTTLQKGYDVDKPRNLAKSVTVE
ncbi:glutamine--fructose-6-phosphate transaminase (isomerizing) [Catellicoccus marimammalium]|uniref:Glutamine--fructose-6-phosphate aminotransferase [isomerizing] n=1 Tax=Catellicoccus marimammalium M35/04/3 TaxID=1234409 RepID=K8ZQ95_9ENTE|nr:glutamine--fructose-6-phosphate transaminase (isomerizing) [Catellicoccus marimammalium]EKU27746.1 isomerizing glucosamine--fructose-6-phosphate aminotransferase [Catellicoccus marimammalium M35/04/3]